jgi:CubicO group peptidase (beta-lactamase class C family)
MKPSFIKFLLLLLFLIPFSATHAQIQKGKLIIGEVITSEINPTETHRYSVNIQKNKFAFFKLMQKDIDIKITTYDTDGEKIENFDSPNGKNGIEPFSITANKNRKYVIEVSPINEHESSGSYELTLELLKPKATTTNEKIDEILISLENDETPGIGIAIVKDGVVKYKKGFGLANLEYGIPIDTSTVFDIASLSKQFTGYAISFLIEQGKFSLDDDIRKYIPEFPDFGHTITIDHLVHHTSGLRDWPNALSIKGLFFDDVISFDQILSMAYNQRELNFTPGSEFLYSNTGYNVLAELIQRVTGESFRQWTETNIFQPLDMNHTHFHDDHTEIVKNKANGYYYDKGDYHVSSNNLTAVGSSSLYTTIDDFIKWSINLHSPKVGGNSIINRMLQKGILNNGEEISYAFGLDIGKYHGITKISHTGSWASFLTYSGYFPDENLSVIIFSNGASLTPWMISNKITDLFLKDKFVDESKKDEPKTAKPNQAGQLEELSQNQLPGNYELEPGVVLEIKIKDDFLHVFQTWNKKTYNIINTTGNTYEIPKDDSIQFTFSKLKDDFTQLVTVFQHGKDSYWNKIEKFDLSKVKLNDFTGNFYSEELSTTYNFVIVDDKLVSKHSRLSDFNLNPLKKDMFTGEAWFFNKVEFIRNSNKVITGFKVSNGRVRNLYFEKVN